MPKYTIHANECPGWDADEKFETTTATPYEALVEFFEEAGVAIVQVVCGKVLNNYSANQLRGGFLVVYEDPECSSLTAKTYPDALKEVMIDFQISISLASDGELEKKACTPPSDVLNLVPKPAAKKAPAKKAPVKKK